MSRPLHVRAEGTPLEIGRRHGELAADLVRSNLDLYFRRFQEEWKVPREEVLRRAGLYEEVIREAEPDYADAMEGVADGSGLPFMEIVALNVRYEIVYSEYTKLGMERRSEMPEECTSLGLLPRRTDNGHLVMAQNWDWIPGVRGLVLQSRPEDGPEVLAFSEAGIVGGKMGLNSRGLGLVINGLVSSKDDWGRLGVPFHVRCWRVLRSGSLAEALKYIRETPGSCSANFLIGEARDTSVDLMDIESSPAGAAELRPREGALTHTNHFHREDALGIWQPLIMEKTSTFERQERVDELLGQLAVDSRLGVGDVRRMLSDHDGRPKSLCRHAEDLVDWPEDQRYETVASVILDLDEKALLLARGRPCESEYHRFSLGA